MPLGPVAEYLWWCCVISEASLCGGREVDGSVVAVTDWMRVRTRSNCRFRLLRYVQYTFSLSLFLLVDGIDPVGEWPA